MSGTLWLLLTFGHITSHPSPGLPTPLMVTTFIPSNVWIPAFYHPARKSRQKMFTVVWRLDSEASPQETGKIIFSRVLIFLSTDYCWFSERWQHSALPAVGWPCADVEVVTLYIRWCWSQPSGSVSNRTPGSQDTQTSPSLLYFATTDCLSYLWALKPHWRPGIMTSEWAMQTCCFMATIPDLQLLAQSWAAAT